MASNGTWRYLVVAELFRVVATTPRRVVGKGEGHLGATMPAKNNESENLKLAPLLRKPPPAAHTLKR